MTRQRIAELIGGEANNSTVFYVTVADGIVSVLEYTYYIKHVAHKGFKFAHVVDHEIVKTVTIKANATDRQVLNAWAKVQ